MSIDWFNKTPGSDIAESQDDPHMLLMGVGVPDWVNVPADTGYGGSYRCLEIRLGPCPLKGHTEQVRHYILAGPVWCAECLVTGQFLWYKAPVPKESEEADGES